MGVLKPVWAAPNVENPAGTGNNSSTPKPAAAPVSSASRGAVAPSTSVGDDSVARKLKSALIEASAKLGELEPWQKRLFDEEALPQYQRFVRNYRSAQTHSGTAISNLEVDIDMESLRNYLRFYAPKTLGREERGLNALVFLRGEESCEKCVAADPAIRKLARARVEHRGLVPVWITAEDLGTEGGELRGKALDSKIAELAVTRNAAASLVMQWGPAPADDVDTAHADEKHFILHVALQARGLAGTGRQAAGAQTVAHTESQTDLQEVDSFDGAAIKQLSDAFVDLGAQAQRAEQMLAAKGDGSGSDDAEVDLDVSGLHAFGQVAKLKSQILTKLPSAIVEERKIARGRLVLALSGLTGEHAQPDIIRTLLTGLPLESGASASKLVAATPESGSGGPSPASADGPPTIAMEIRP